MRRIAAILASTLVLALLATDAPAVGAAVGPNIRVGVQRNDDLVTGVRDRRLIFSEATSESDPRAPRRMRVRNIGDAPLNVNLVISGANPDDFNLVNGTPGTFTLAPNAFQDVFVDFAPTAVGRRFATLEVNSNDPRPPMVPVLLRGINAAGYEEANEPTLDHLLNTVGFSPQGLPSRNLLPGEKFPPDELTDTAGYFRPANPARRTMLLPIARYSTITASASPFVSWYPRGSSGSLQQLHSFPGGSDPSGGQNQRLLPTYTGGAVFRPNGDFGINSASEFSDFTKNPGQVRNFRFFNARSNAGNARGDIWIITQDIGSGGTVKNNDYNDIVWLLVNAVPA
jgi:hypothetical protein